MEYIQQIPTLLIIAVAIIILVVPFVAFLPSEYIGVGVFGGLILLGIGFGSLWIVKNASDYDITQKISNHYGIDLTVKDFAALSYPKVAPSENTYYGTTEISIGSTPEDFKSIKLMVTGEGKIVLLEKINEEFVEIK